MVTMAHNASRYSQAPQALLSKSDARDLLGISAAGIDRLVRRGELGCVRVGRRVMFTVADIDDYIQRNRVPVP
jgi:excisionase family DNA binding protein